MILKTLRNIFITIVVIAIIVIGGLFGLNAYSNQHPNNHSINDWNKLNPLAPTYEYYVKTQKPSKVEVVDKEKISISIITIKRVTRKMVNLKIEYTASKN